MACSPFKRLIIFSDTFVGLLATKHVMKVAFFYGYFSVCGARKLLVVVPLAGG